MVSTLDFESSDPSSNLGGTYFYFSIFLSFLIFLLQRSIFLLLNFYFTVFRHKSNKLLINKIFYFILIKSGRRRHTLTRPQSSLIISIRRGTGTNSLTKGMTGRKKGEGRDSQETPLLSPSHLPRAYNPSASLVNN